MKVFKISVLCVPQNSQGESLTALKPGVLLPPVQSVQGEEQLL